VDFDGDTAAVVVDCDGAVFAVDVDFDVVHAWIADFVVCGVDEDFIKDLVQTRHNLDIPTYQRYSSVGVYFQTIISFSES